MLAKQEEKTVWDIKEQTQIPEVMPSIFVGPSMPASSQRNSLSHNA